MKHKAEGKRQQEENKTNKVVSDEYNAVLTLVSDKGSIGYKDLYLTQGIETTAGSRVLEGYKPPYSATIVGRLEKAGMSVKAKLNCDAWAHGSSGENSDFGPTTNPWNQNYTPGGSSSGSAAAVAAGLMTAAAGTDTGGSIRLPASFTNTVGLKPTYGALSRYGIVAMASSLDSPGFFARTVGEVRKLYAAAAKSPDAHDATTQSPKREYRGGRLNEGHYHIAGLRIGLPKEFFATGVDDQVKKIVQQAAKTLSSTGAKLIEVSLPHTKYGISAYYIVQTTEVASNLARYDGIRYGHQRSSFGSEAKRRIMLGTFSSSAGYTDRYFEKAAKVRTLLIQDFVRAFEKVDVLLGPVSPTPPFKLGEKTADPLKMYLSDVLTVTINLVGIPALALPCGFTQNNLPIGMQLIGPRWSEELLFSVGQRYQQLTQWHERLPG